MGAGFRAGTPVKIVFDANPDKVLGTAVADPDGSFKASVVVPRGQPGSHRIQVEGVSPTGRHLSLATVVVLLADETAFTVPTHSGLARPVMLTLSVVLPLATWLALEVLGWRRRHLNKHP